MSTAVIQKIAGRAVPVRGNDIDTDRIIPARFLVRVTFDGLGKHAFEDDIAALAAKGEKHPFRDEKYLGASILVSNSNFGCGSSREHAPQALNRWGITAIIAQSYSEIFFGNCVAIGIPCFTASQSIVEEILAWIEANPQKEVLVQVADETATIDGKVLSLSLPSSAKGQFLDGTWNARAQLLANLDKVRNIAGQIPYFSNFS